MNEIEREQFDLLDKYFYNFGFPRRYPNAWQTIRSMVLATAQNKPTTACACCGVPVDPTGRVVCEHCNSRCDCHEGSPHTP